MAKVTDNILAGYPGRFKDFIIYQLHGNTYIRSRQGYKAPTGAGQTAQQERIASVAIFYKAMCAAGLKKNWEKAEKPIQWNSYNLFMHRNLPAFTAGGVIGNYDKLQLTAGSLQLPDEITLRAGEGEEWVMEWSNRTLYPPSGEDDRLQIALMSERDRFSVRLPDIGDFRRRDTRAVFRISEEYKDYVHLFCYFCSETDDLTSESKYMINLKNRNYGNRQV